MYKRPKEVTLFKNAGDFWQQKGGVRYVAHAITNRGRAILLRDEQPPFKGNTKVAEHHPDRLYWEKGITRPAHLRLQRDEELVRLEIDCSLMPCGSDVDGCTFVIPSKIREWEFDADLELRVFAHRNEGEGTSADPSTRRYFRCRLNDTKDRLLELRRHSEGWSWKKWLEGENPADPYP